MPTEATRTSAVSLSLVIPCFNEERTLEKCVERVMELRTPQFGLEVIIVDDHSTDGSLTIARALAARYPEIRVLHHDTNRGKGAALRSGFSQATGDFVAVQDADLEYDPSDLHILLGPLRDGRADVVLGSRFKGQGPHRVLYFWHYVGNRFLTLLSNMFTDLNLSDMETCYKVFRRDVIQAIKIQEDRFGFEPEIVAKVGRGRYRVYEAAISYNGRTYEEGKKINWKDGVRALYCIFRYNADRLPWPMQFAIYLLIGGLAALVNLAAFLVLFGLSSSLTVSVWVAFAIAAMINYFLCIWLLFRHNARWNSVAEVIVYLLVVTVAGGIDWGVTDRLYAVGAAPWLAKSIASGVGIIFNFLSRRFIVF